MLTVNGDQSCHTTVTALVVVYNKGIHDKVRDTHSSHDSMALLCQEVWKERSKRGPRLQLLAACIARKGHEVTHLRLRIVVTAGMILMPVKYSSRAPCSD
eukprot:378571-Pelagomonas_calceolata.AAC.2